MYNQEWKDIYLSRNNFSESEKKAIETAFIGAKSLEEHYNKDLCKFNISEVKKLLETTENKFNKLYYDYCNWCLSEALILYINPYEIFIEEDEEELDDGMEDELSAINID